MTERAEPLSIAPESSVSDELLPIREVVRLTGVNPVTLRAWERRYGLIQPVRTEGGHRLYSAQDVATIRSIMLWTDRGVSVSKVGSILTRNASAANAPPSQPAAVDAAAGEWQQWQQSLLQALQQFDQARLDQLYGQVFSTYPLSVAFEQVLMPVWYQQRLESGFGHVSQWLFLDTFLRARVLQRLQALRQPNAECVLLAALPGACRELELLVAGLLLGGEEGAIRVLPLGQPFDELSLICQAVKPKGLVLFAPAPPAAATLRQLDKLVLAIDCPLALAGPGAELVQDSLQGTAVANLGAASGLMRRRLAQFLTGHLDT
jgi:DNA-binding transcriptional MerR regulator